MRLPDMLCWSCYNSTQDVCCGLSGAPELQSYGSECCGMLRICQLVSLILKQQLNISLTDFFAKWDWQICRDWSGLIRLMTHPEDSPVNPEVVGSCCLQTPQFKMRMWCHVSCAPQTHNRHLIQGPCLHHAQKLTSAIYRQVGQQEMCNVAYQLSLSHIGHY